MTEPFEKFLNCIFHKTKKSNKKFHIAGDFNLNVLDHDNCKKVQNFLNLLYQNNMIPIINKPTRVTKKTATAIDHIITNCFVDTNFKTAIFKSDISDHFLICVFLSPMIDENKNEVTYIYKRNINSEKIEKFNQKLYEIDWNEVKICEHPSQSYEIFLTKFLSIYGDFFPKKKIKVKSKDVQSPSITAGIKKSSKRKQQLYEKFLKCRSERNEDEYKNYKRLFETIKKR